MDYLNKTEAFHEELRLFFYPKIFDKQNANTVNWDEIKPRFYNTKLLSASFKRLMPLIGTILLVLVLAIPSARRL